MTACFISSCGGVVADESWCQEPDLRPSAPLLAASEVTDVTAMIEKMVDKHKELPQLR